MNTAILHEDRKTMKCFKSHKPIILYYNNAFDVLSGFIHLSFLLSSLPCYSQSMIIRAQGTVEHSMGPAEKVAACCSSE